MPASTLTVLSGHLFAFIFFKNYGYKTITERCTCALGYTNFRQGRKTWQTFKALHDNASVKVMQDDPPLLSELHMGLSLTR